MIFKKDDSVRFTKDTYSKFYRHTTDVINYNPGCRMIMTVSHVNEEYDEVFTEEFGTMPINSALLEKVQV